MPLKSIKNSSQKQKDLAQSQILKSGRVWKGQSGQTYDPKGICPTIYSKGTGKTGGNAPIIDLGVKTTTKQKSKQVELFDTASMEKSTLLLLDSLAKICQLLENEKELEAQEVVSSLKQQGLSMFVNPSILSLKTSKVFSQVTTGNVLRRACKRLPTLGMMVNGNFLILSGGSPRIESGYTLSDILEPQVDPKYFLSEKAVMGIQAHKERHKALNKSESCLKKES